MTNGMFEALFLTIAFGMILIFGVLSVIVNKLDASLAELKRLK